MPSLPVFGFWNAFHRYYNLHWVTIERYTALSTRKPGLSLPLHFFDDDNDDIYKYDYNNHHNHSMENWNLIRRFQYLTRHSILSILVISIFLSFTCLWIPLKNYNYNHNDDDENNNNNNNDDGSKEINLYAYIAYLQIYQLLSYPLLLMIADFSLPDIVDSMKIKVCFLPILSQLLAIGFYAFEFIMHGRERLMSSFNRTVGTSIQAAIVYITYIIACVYISCRKPNHYISSKHEYTQSESSIEIAESRSTLKKNANDNHNEGENDGPMNQSIEIKSEPVEILFLWFQCTVAIILYIVVTASYYWCQYLTWRWSSHSSNTSIYFFLTFWFVMTISRFICKRLARLVDKNKSNTLISVEICMEFLMACFYYVFYRNLFLHVSTVEEFVAMKALHVLAELSQYPFRMTRLYFEKTRVLQDQLMNTCGRSTHTSNTVTSSSSPPSSDEPQNICLTIGGGFAAFMHDPCNYEIWCVRLSVDYTIRYIISIGSGIAFIAGVCWAKYGYNQHFLPLGVETKQFDKTLCFVTIGVVIDVVLYLFIDWLCIKRLHMEMVRYWTALVYHRPLYLLFMIVAAQHVMTDVIIAKLHIE